MHSAPGMSNRVFDPYKCTESGFSPHLARFSATLIGKSRMIPSNRPRTIVVAFHPAYSGRYEDTLELAFHDVERRHRFVITRRVHAIVGSQDDHQQLKPKAPYSKKKYTPFEHTGWIVPSLRPPTWSATKWAIMLPSFNIPNDLIKAAFDRTPRAAHAAMKSLLPQSFNQDTYGRFFQSIVYIEEEQLRSAIICMQAVADLPA